MGVRDLCVGCVAVESSVLTVNRAMQNDVAGPGPVARPVEEEEIDSSTDSEDDDATPDASNPATPLSKKSPVWMHFHDFDEERVHIHCTLCEELAKKRGEPPPPPVKVHNSTREAEDHMRRTHMIRWRTLSKEVEAWKAARAKRKAERERKMNGGKRSMLHI